MLSQLYIFAGLLCISVLGQKQSKYRFWFFLCKRFLGCNSSLILSSDYTFGKNFTAYPFQPQNNQFCYFEVSSSYTSQVLIFYFFALKIM